MRFCTLLRFCTLSMIAALAISLAASCTQPPVACTVSAAFPYAAKYSLVSGEGACAELRGDRLGFGAYNPPKVVDNDGQGDAPEVQPDLNRVSIAIRTGHLGDLVANASAGGIVDTTEGHAPHAFGEFSDPFPDAAGICRPGELSPAQQTLGEVAEDLGDVEDPDDDILFQPATNVMETWTDVEVFVTAAALGTQVRGTYTLEQDGCTAVYEFLAVFPQVPCGVFVEDEALAPVAITFIDDSGEGGTLIVETAEAHGLIAGDLVEILDVDDIDRSFDGIYTVVAAPSTTTFFTGEVDPFDGDEPDAAASSGTVQRVLEVPNPDLCSPVALPDKGIAVGSGISPDFPVVCDPDLLTCVLDESQDAEPGFPITR